MPGARRRVRGGGERRADVGDEAAVDAGRGPRLRPAGRRTRRRRRRRGPARSRHVRGRGATAGCRRAPRRRPTCSPGCVSAQPGQGARPSRCPAPTAHGRRQPVADLGPSVRPGTALPAAVADDLAGLEQDDEERAVRLGLGVRQGCAEPVGGVRRGPARRGRERGERRQVAGEDGASALEPEPLEGQTPVLRHDRSVVGHAEPLVRTRCRARARTGAVSSTCQRRAPCAREDGTDRVAP